MSNELTKSTGQAVAAVTPEQYDLVRSIIFKDATPAELKLYLYECHRRKVHPLDRLIHPVKRHDNATGEDRVTFQASIDYLRMESEASGDYAGMDEPDFGPIKDLYPEWARCVVYRYLTRPDGQCERVAFAATAYWAEFYPGDKQGFMWRNKPRVMLGKVAEAQARRRAWPQKFQGLYEEAEMMKLDDTGVSGSGGSYVNTVREQQTGGQGSVTTTKTVNDTLRDELIAFCEKAGVDPVAIICQITKFTDNKTKKDVFFQGGIDDLHKLKNAWAGSALKNLRDMAGKYKLIPASCTENPATCAESCVDDNNVYYCSNGRMCEFAAKDTLV